MKKQGVLTLDAGGSMVKAGIFVKEKAGLKLTDVIFFDVKGWKELESGVKAIYDEFFGGFEKVALSACFAGRVAHGGETISVTKWGEPKKGASLFKGMKFSTMAFVNDMEAAIIGVKSVEFDAIQEGAEAPEAFSLVYLGSGMGVANDFTASEFGAAAIPLNPSDALEKKICGKKFARYEEYLSGPGLSALAKKLGHGKLTPEEVSGRIAKGELKDVATLFARLLGRALKNIVLTTLVDTVILGGKPLKALNKKYYPVMLKELAEDELHGWWLETVNILRISGDEELPLEGLRNMGLEMLKGKKVG